MSCAELMGEMSNRDVSGNGGEDEGGAKGGVKGELNKRARAMHGRNGGKNQ